MKRLLSILIVGALCPAMGGAEAAQAARPSFCTGLAQNAELRGLGATLSALGTPEQRSGDVLAISRVGRLFARAASRSTGASRGQFLEAQADLNTVRRAGRISADTARRMQKSFGALDRKVAKRCGMPVTDPAMSPVFKPTPRAKRLAGPDPGLCNSKNDGRVRIPQNFRIDVCWDGSSLVIKNRTTVVLRIVTEGGLPPAVQGINEPPPLSSLFTASNFGRDIIPPQYTETVTAATGGGAVRIIFADQNILTRHAVAALIEEVLPLNSAVGAYAAFTQLVTGLDKAQATATVCLAGANAFKRVQCLAIFTRDAAYEFGVAGLALGIEAGKAVPKTVGRIWSIISVSKLVESHFKDLATVVAGAERIDIAPATSPGTSPPGGNPPEIKPFPTQPPSSTPTPAPPPPPLAPTSLAVTVDNRVTNGGSAMREDTSAYLSTVTRNFCRRDGCMLGGTEVGSGNVITAECTVFGDRTTNGNDGNANDDGNPGLFSSTRWYGIRWGDGRLGYISEVWLRPSDRGGKGLRGC